MKSKLRKMIAWILVLVLMSADVCAIAATLELPKALTIIGEEAFYGATSIDEVVVHDEVTEIRSKAFANSSITEINLPESIEHIADDAFDGCEDIDITVEEDTYAYDWAMKKGYVTPSPIPTPTPSDISDFDYEVINDEYVSITQYIGSDVNVVVPATIEGYPVTSIGDNAFEWCDSITSITLPYGIVSIGEFAFCACRGLTRINIPDSVTSIGDYAFQSCNKLMNIIFGNSVTSIGFSAFASCHSLTSITIPDSVTSLGNYAFSGCDGLTSITIGNGLTSISGLAFPGCSNLTSITFGNNVTSIGGGAFEDCISLTSITIPDGVDFIGVGAFEGCIGLANITMPDSVASIGEGAFKGCISLTNITIPDSVTSISRDTFEGCSNLTSITIPDSVTSIGAYAFEGCSSLTGITIPESVTSIGDYAFIRCGAGLTIYGVAGSEAERYAEEYNYDFKVIDEEDVSSKFEYQILYNEYVNITGYTGSDAQLVIPSTIEDYPVTSIGDRAFSSNAGLISVTIPDSVTSIGDYVFSYCRNLTSITIGDGITRLYATTFGTCDNLANVIIGDGVTTIGDDTFKNRDNLISVTIGNSVKYIGKYAFEGCDGLTSITIPDSVTSIEHHAFANCSNLTSIAIPNRVAEIGFNAFSGCSSLASITIGNGVTSIGSNAFYDCSSLTSITIPGNVVEIGGGAFSDCSSLANVSICNGVLSIYPSAFRNCTNLPSITIPDSVTYIGGRAFENCSSLTSITIPNRVTEIISSTFERCTSLANVTIGNGVTKIWSNAFYGCSALTNLVIPNNVTTIELNAFGNCSSLIRVTIPECLLHCFETYYSEYAFFSECFGNNNSIREVIIADGIYTIYGGHFRNCPNLSSIYIPSSVKDIDYDAFEGCSPDLTLYGEAGSEAEQFATSHGYEFLRNTVGSDTRYGFAVSHGTKDGLIAGADGGRGLTITVVSTGSWTIESDSDWIHLSTSGGESGETFYTITDKNPIFEQRTGYITVRCDGFKPIVIKLVQNASVRKASIVAHTPEVEKITNDSIVITGQLIWNEDESIASYQNVGVQYGLESEDWIATIAAQIDTTTGELITTVGNLESGKTYKFRAVAQHTETLEWMESEPVTAKIEAYCEHQYGNMIYAYDTSVRAYHDRYLNAGYDFLPTAFIENEETETSHSIRHPYIRVCSLCDRFEVLYVNSSSEHTFETITETIYENITTETHDAYEVTKVICTTALDATSCGYTQSEERVLIEAEKNHVFEEGVCACGEGNVVWAAKLNGTLYIDVAVASGQPNAEKDYLFIAEDENGLHYSDKIPAGKTSATFGIKNDLQLLRSKTYALYVLPEGISLTEDNRGRYSIGDITIPLFNGKMVTSVYSGKNKVASNNNLYVGDTIQINWDGSYGVEHAQVVVNLNTTEVFNKTYNYSGPGTVTIDSESLKAEVGDTLTVTVTVDPNAVATASVMNTRASTVQPVSYSWTGTFVSKPTLGYTIELDWNGVRSDVTNQKIYMSTASGAPNYFGLRAYLDGELINLTDPDNCEYEWKFQTSAIEIENGIEVAYAHDGNWMMKRLDGFTFYFNGNTDRFKNDIELHKKGEDEQLAHVQFQINKYGTLISGADVGYNEGDYEYNETISISDALYNSWYRTASLAERRLWFDLNYKRTLIDNAVPSNTVEGFFDACEESFLWDLRYKGISLTLKVGDFLGNAASDIIDFAVAGIKWSSSWPLALYSDVKYGSGSFSERFEETKNLLKNFENATVDGKVVNSFTNHDKHTDAIINYLTINAENMAQKTGRSEFEKETAQSIVDGIAALKKTTDASLKSPLDKLIEWVAIETNTDFAGAFTMNYNGIELGEVMVDVQIGTKSKSFTLEQVLSASALTDYSTEFSNKQTLEFLEQLRDGEIDINAEQASKQGFIWTIINNDTKVELYNEMYPASKMMGKIGDFLKTHNVDAWLDAAEAGINGYKAWTVAEQYDKLLAEFEVYLNSLEPEDNAWVQDVLDELVNAASNKTLTALEAIGEEYTKNGLKKLSSDACQKVLNKLLGEGAEKAVAQLGTLSGAVWSGIELGNMLSNAAGSVGKIPSVSEVIKLYEDAQDGLYKAMDKYTTNPSLQNYKDLKMKAELYTILKGSAIVTMNAVFREDQESIKARFVNWVSWQAKTTSAFYSALFTGDWASYYNAYGQDNRVKTISDIDQAMYGELDQMQDMLDMLFPISLP